MDDGIGKEITTQITTTIKSNRTFYTDSNGRDFIQRVHFLVTACNPIYHSSHLTNSNSYSVTPMCLLFCMRILAQIFGREERVGEPLGFRVLIFMLSFPMWHLCLILPKIFRCETQGQTGSSKLTNQLLEIITLYVSSTEHH